MQINGNHQCNASNRSDTLRRLTRCPELDKEKLCVAIASTHEIADQLEHYFAERWAGRSSHRRSEAAPPLVRRPRGLQTLLRSQRGPNAIQSLPETRIAGRIRRREKRWQAHRQQPIQMGGIVGRKRAPPPAHRWMLPRNHVLGRIPRLEGFSCHSHLTKKHEVHPFD